MKKLREGIDATLEANDYINETGVIVYDTTKHLSYMRACLDE